MEWKYTKKYFKQFVRYSVGCFATGITFVAAFGGNMVGYYCAPGAPPFIGFKFTASQFCSLQVAFIFILSMTVGFMVVLLFGSVVVDVGIVAINFLHNESAKPRIKHRFELSKEKDLWLSVWVSRWSKPVQVEFYFKELENDKGRKFSNHVELVSTWSQEYKHGNITGKLNPGQTVEFPVGIYIREIFSLRSPVAWVQNYPDGMYKYTIGCKGRYRNIEFDHLDFSVWLVISNNKLVEIKHRPT